MTRDEVLESLRRCTLIDDEGYMVPMCDGCPMIDEEWKQKGHVCCRAFKELQVSIPYALAEAVMKELTDSCRSVDGAVDELKDG